MTYLKANKVPKNIVEKTTSLAIATILITSMFVWVIPITPAFAVANATITASGATAPWQDEDDFLIQISIVDPDFAGNDDSNENITVTVNERTEAGTLVDTNPSTATELFNTGLFYLYLRNDSSSFQGDNDPILAFDRYFGVNSSGLAEEDGTVEVEYQDVSGPVTITVEVEIDNDRTDLVSDRVGYPPDGIIHLTATDQDINNDPTAINVSIPVDIDLEVNLANGTILSCTFCLVAIFTETDVNSAVFENMNSTSLSDYATALGLTAEGKTFVDGDILNIEFEDPSPTGGSDDDDIDIEIVEEDGVLSVPTSAIYSTDLEILVIDSDLNKDTEEEDSTEDYSDPLLVNVTLIEVFNGTTLVDAERVNMTEVDDNSSTFENEDDIDITWDYDWTATPTHNNSDIEIRCGFTLRISYIDPSAQNPGASNVTSQVIIPIACVDPTISADPPTIGLDYEVQLALINPNANNDKDTRETIISSEGGDVTLEENDVLEDIQFNSSDIWIGNMTIRIQEGGSGSFDDAEAANDFTLVFRETDEDTGTYTLTTELDTEDIRYAGTADDPLADEDVIEVCWTDLIDPDEPDTCVEITISSQEGTITLDRTKYPVARDNVVIRITITDQDANTDDNIQETLILGDNEIPRIENIGGGMLQNVTAFDPSGFIILTETTPSSGIFVTEITINQTLTKDIPATNNDTRQWINAKLIIEYYDPSIDDLVDPATARFRLNDITLNVNVTTVRYGDVFSVTITDNDNDLDPLEEDTVLYNITYVNTAGSEVELNLLEAEETGNSTGIFVDTLTIGESGEDGFSPAIDPDEVITITAWDNTPSTAAPTEDPDDWPDDKELEVEITTMTTTGTLTISPAGEFGPGTNITITLNDFDLNTDIGDEDTTAEDVVRIKTTTCPNGISVELEETDDNTGIFELVNVTVVLAAADPADECDTNTDDEQIEANIGDLVQIVYLDDADASGNSRSVVLTASVTSWDPVMSFEQGFYNPDDVATLTIEDFDGNTNPEIIDTLAVRITSDSDPIGLALTAVETEDNTGIFTLSFTIKDEVEADTLFVAVGDTITATYEDPFPADIDPDDDRADWEKDFTATVLVGVELPPTERVPASTPETVDALGNAVASPAVNTVTVIQAEVCNDDTSSHTFTFFVQIKDANGVVIAINWIQDFTLAAGACATPGISWTPTNTGSYTLEVFVWESIANPIALSPLFSKTVTVV